MKEGRDSAVDLFAPSNNGQWCDTDLEVRFASKYSGVGCGEGVPNSDTAILEVGERVSDEARNR